MHIFSLLYGFYVTYVIFNIKTFIKMVGIQIFLKIIDFLTIINQ
jgi:hypothetical protein